MATADALSSLYWIHDFSIIIVVCLIATTPAAKYCYHGFDVSSPYSLENQSCSTGQVHLLKTLLDTDQDTSSTYMHEKTHSHYVNNGGLSIDSANEINYHCFIFRFVATQTFFPDVQHESVHMEFGCDFRNVCHNKEPEKVLHWETVNGSQGQLFCCNIENCNEAEDLPHLPAENRVCYHGTNNRSEVTAAEKVSCTHPDVMCAKITTYFSDGKVESYFCDNDQLCQDKMLAGSFRSCHTSLSDNTTHELCCCDTSLCFIPPDPEGRSTNFSVSHVLDTRTIYKLADERDEKMAITGLVIALVFVCGIVGGVVFMMVCKMRRRPRPDPNLIMQYERLSASEVDVDEAVVL